MSGCVEAARAGLAILVRGSATFEPAVRWRLVGAGIAVSVAVLVGDIGWCGAQSAGAGRDKTLIEQKLMLLDSLLQSPRMAAAESGADDSLRAKFSEAKNLAAAANAAFAAGDLGAAENAADAAMRAAAAAKGEAAAAPDAEKQRARNGELLRQIRSYRDTLAGAWTAAVGAEAGSSLLRLDRLIAEAEELATAGRHADANRILGEAYRTAVSLVSKQRAGQIVVYQLNFATAADEYAYEQERHRSHEMLIGIALAERGMERDTIASYLRRSEELRAGAEAAAGLSSYDEAVADMERATAELVRALQSLGVPVTP